MEDSVLLRFCCGRDLIGSRGRGGVFLSGTVGRNGQNSTFAHMSKDPAFVQVSPAGKAAQVRGRKHVLSPFTHTCTFRTRVDESHFWQNFHDSDLFFRTIRTSCRQVSKIAYIGFGVWSLGLPRSRNVNMDKDAVREHYKGTNVDLPHIHITHSRFTIIHLDTSDFDGNRAL